MTDRNKSRFSCNVRTLFSQYSVKKHSSVKQFYPSVLLPTKRFVFLLNLLAFDRLSLVRRFFWHSIVKQALTDGAQYVMTFFDVLDFGEQGYSIIHVFFSSLLFVYRKVWWKYFANAENRRRLFKRTNYLR